MTIRKIIGVAINTAKDGEIVRFRPLTDEEEKELDKE